MRGLDSAEVRQACVRVLREELAPEFILERPDPRMRELEGLSAPDLAPLWADPRKAPITRTVFRLNGLDFQYDANSGQKTGAFLDQRMNYVAAAEWAQRLNATGRALDVCTYQGGFALHLAQGLPAGDGNRRLARVAGGGGSESGSRIGDDWARRWIGLRRMRSPCCATGPMRTRKFDAIVLDPPAFAKSKRAVEGALRGYKELNLRALKMLRPGGLLVTCSCSHHVALADLEGVVAAAAADAHRRVRLLERRGAAPDHPGDSQHSGDRVPEVPGAGSGVTKSGC